MKNFWNYISKKDLIFGLIILVLVIVMSFKPSNKIRFYFEEDSVDIKTTKYSMNIPYDMVESLELVSKPDMGTKIDGYTDNIIANGLWKNDVWGEYTACVEVYTDNCILVHLTDGRLFVLSRRDNEETQRVYEEFLTYLN
jgi:hypothetical protein